jgi:hypothetical protein
LWQKSKGTSENFISPGKISHSGIKKNIAEHFLTVRDKKGDFHFILKMTKNQMITLQKECTWRDKNYHH